MSWYTESIIKEAAQSEDHLLSAFQQTWPQFVEIIKKFKNEFLPSIENKSEDEKNMLSFVFWSLFNNYLFLCSYSSSKAIEMIDCSEMYEKLLPKVFST